MEKTNDEAVMLERLKLATERVANFDESELPLDEIGMRTRDAIRRARLAVWSAWRAMGVEVDVT